MPVNPNNLGINRSQPTEVNQTKQQQAKSVDTTAMFSMKTQATKVSNALERVGVPKKVQIVAKHAVLIPLKTARSTVKGALFWGAVGGGLGVLAGGVGAIPCAAIGAATGTAFGLGVGGESALKSASKELDPLQEKKQLKKEVLRDDKFVRLLASHGEKGSIPDALEKIEACISGQSSEKYGAVLDDLNQAIRIGEINTIEERADIIFDELESAGKVLFGFRIGHHQLYMQIVRNDDDTHLVRIFNSGGGLIHHVENEDGSKFSTMTETKVSGSTRGTLIEILKKDIAFSRLSDRSNDGYKEIDKLYSWFDELEGASTDLTRDLVFQSPQKIGNCTLEAVFAVLKNIMPDEDYQTLRLELFKDALQAQKGKLFRNKPLIKALEGKVERREVKMEQKLSSSNSSETTPANRVSVSKKNDRLTLKFLLIEIKKLSDDNFPEIKLENGEDISLKEAAEIVYDELFSPLQSSSEIKRQLSEKDKEKILESIIKKSKEMRVTGSRRLKLENGIRVPVRHASEIIENAHKRGMQLDTQLPPVKPNKNASNSPKRTQPAVEAPPKEAPNPLLDALNSEFDATPVRDVKPKPKLKSKPRPKRLREPKPIAPSVVLNTDIVSEPVSKKEAPGSLLDALNKESVVAPIQRHSRKSKSEFNPESKLFDKSKKSPPTQTNRSSVIPFDSDWD
ncbi:hypothetical protein HOH87_02375 [bacterium]|nr:hypothetical protein [bacterium]